MKGSLTEESSRLVLALNQLGEGGKVALDLGEGGSRLGESGGEGSGSVLSRESLESNGSLEGVGTIQQGVRRGEIGGKMEREGGRRGGREGGRRKEEGKVSSLLLTRLLYARFELFGRENDTYLSLRSSGIGPSESGSGGSNGGEHSERKGRRTLRGGERDVDSPCFSLRAD